MGLNKKGQSIFISIIYAIEIFLIGMLLINFLKPELITARDSSNLDCANSSGITDGNKLLCLFTSITLPLFILAICSLAGGYIISKYLI